MLKLISRFFFAILLIGIGDIALLYYIYSAWGMGAFIAFVILPPFVGGNLVRIARQRLAQSPEGMQQFGHGMLFLIAHFLFIFPGPISTFLALLLLIPSVRTALQFLVRDQIQKAVSNGTLTVVSGFNAAHVREQQGSDIEHLERAEGRVVDDSELEPPKQLESR